MLYKLQERLCYIGNAFVTRFSTIGKVLWTILEYVPHGIQTNAKHIRVLYAAKRHYSLDISMNCKTICRQSIQFPALIAYFNCRCTLASLKGCIVVPSHETIDTMDGQQQLLK